MSSYDGTAYVLNGIDLTVERGQVWGLVGETGCGKSLTGLSVARLVPSPPACYRRGRITVAGHSVLDAPETVMRTLRGRRIGMIFQDPTTNLNPAFTVGTQIVDVALHAGTVDLAILGVEPGASRRDRRRAARRLAVAMLDRVGIAHAAARIDDYPHQFSGGMRQRVLIAMALIGRPDLLIADEPTTALDVSVQAQILGLIYELVLGIRPGRAADHPQPGHRRPDLQSCGRHVRGQHHRIRNGPGDLQGAVASLHPSLARRRSACGPETRRVAGAGRVRAEPIEAAERLPAGPTLPPRAAALRRFLPARRGRGRRPRRRLCAGSPGRTGMILEVEHLTKSFPIRRRHAFAPRGSFLALDDLTLSVRQGECFGLLGESGSGKTTLTRCILGLERVTSGRIRFEGADLSRLSPAALRNVRARIQVVFQDPYASLNPRMTVRDIVAEPMEVHHREVRLGPRQRTDRVRELLGLVGLDQQHLHRYPHEFSGGQRQRIGVARALAVRPGILLLDEPTSALDVSVQAQVLNLLLDLQRRLGLTYLFISHDLGVVRYMCDRVALIRRGTLVEEGEASAMFEHPRTDYAQMLLAAMPEPDPDKSPFRRPATSACVPVQS